MRKATRFPEAQSTPTGLGDVERAIRIIQNATVFSLPSVESLPATGVAGQVLQTAAGIFTWNTLTQAWVAAGGGGNDFFNY